VHGLSRPLLAGSATAGAVGTRCGARPCVEAWAGVCSPVQRLPTLRTWVKAWLASGGSSHFHPHRNCSTLHHSRAAGRACRSPLHSNGSVGAHGGRASTNAYSERETRRLNGRAQARSPSGRQSLTRPTSRWSEAAPARNEWCRARQGQPAGPSANTERLRSNLRISISNSLRGPS
jgi:hypothetical protein